MAGKGEVCFSRLSLLSLCSLVFRHWASNVSVNSRIEVYCCRIESLTANAQQSVLHAYVLPWVLRLWGTYEFRTRTGMSNSENLRGLHA